MDIHQIANEVLEALAGINLNPDEGRALFFLIGKLTDGRKKLIGSRYPNFRKA